MLVVQLHQRVLDLALGRGADRVQPQQADCAVVVGAGDELVVAVVVLGLREEVVVVLIAAHRHVPSPYVPKLERLVVAGHEVALLVGVVVHAQDLVSALLAGLNHVLVAEWANRYLLDFLSQIWTSLPLLA